MLSIDIQFVGKISHLLRNFSHKKAHLWQFSCNFCGDSKKNIRKARAYIFSIKNQLFVKCHNCSRSVSFGTLIKELNPVLYQEYCLERFSNGAGKYIAHKEIPNIITAAPPFVSNYIQDSTLDELKSIDILPDGHIAKEYVLSRKIPEDKHYLLYYCPNFREWTNTIKFSYPNIEKDEPRLIIPYFNQHGKVFAFQGRALDNNKVRYISIKLDDTAEKVYGLDRVDFQEEIFVLEGPIDSLFLPNAIAVSGSDMNTDTVQKIKARAVLITDNNPRNTEVCKSINKVIKKNFRVCLFPKSIQEKDINDLVLSGWTQEQILTMIKQNTFQGFEAEMRFSEWRRN